MSAYRHSGVQHSGGDAARFWLTSTEAIGHRLEQYAREAADAELTTIGTSHRGRPIPRLRIGSGPLKLAVVAAMHGYEVVGTYACLALAESLVSGRDLDGTDISHWAHETRSRQTVFLISMASPDVTARFFDEFPTGHWTDRFSTDAADWDAYVRYINEPRPQLQARHPAQDFTRGFRADEVAEWVSAGRHLGLRWTEQGLDPWKDWETFQCAETRALRDYLHHLRPNCVFELHNQEQPSSIFLPIPTAQGAAAQKQVEYGEAIHNAAGDTGLPYTKHSMHAYHYPEHSTEFPDWALRELGCLVLWGELWTGYFNDAHRELMRQTLHRCRDADTPPPTDEEMIRVGWVWLQKAIELGNQRGYQ
jgi:hypothetical protein